jgi:hypothetical protein
LLPQRVRELHDLDRTRTWGGRVAVARGASLPSRIAAAIAGLPPEGPEQRLTVTFEPSGRGEVWSRHFGSALFRSLQYARDGALCERVGPATLVFTPVASSDGLALRLDGFWVLGLPVPRFMHPIVCTFEKDRDGRYEFEVEAHLPLAGLLVRYAGWLEPL